MQALWLFPTAESADRYDTCVHGLRQAFCRALGWSAQANLGFKLILNSAREWTNALMVLQCGFSKMLFYMSQLEPMGIAAQIVSNQKLIASCEREW